MHVASFIRVWTISLVACTFALSSALSDDDEEKFARDVARLIDGLASRHTMPPAGSTTPAPDEPQVWKSADALQKLGVRAFPYLIAHFDDKRFSFSEGTPAAHLIYHRSVGRLCHKIVDRQVKKLKTWAEPDPRGSPGWSQDAVPQYKIAAERWWAENKDKELWQLQADFVQQVISWNEERLPKIPDDKSRRLCEDAIRANEKLRDELKTTKEALPTTPFRPYFGR